MSEENDKEVMLVASGGPMDGTQVPASAFNGVIKVGGLTGVYMDEGKRVALYELGETSLSYQESLSVYRFMAGPMGGNSFAVRNPPPPNSIAFCQIDKGEVTQKAVRIVNGGKDNPVPPEKYPLFGYIRMSDEQDLVFFGLLHQENFEEYVKPGSTLVNEAIKEMGLQVCTHKPDIIILPTTPVHAVEHTHEYGKLTDPPEQEETTDADNDSFDP